MRTIRMALRRGARGEEVRDLQQALAAAGLDPGPPDGIFGQRTVDAVRAFQARANLAVDGVVGPRTWAALDRPAQPASAPAAGTARPAPARGAGRTISEAGLAFIGRLEGLRLQLYKDAAGHCTIGYGHLVHRAPCSGEHPEEFRRGITGQRALELLQDDADRFVDAVNQAVTVPLTQAQFDALVSFAFNVGTRALRDSTLLRRLNAGDHSAIPGELARWTSAGGNQLPGLVRRRKAEGRLFAEGRYEA